MTSKPSYSELEQRILTLEASITNKKQSKVGSNSVGIEIDALFNKAPLAMFIVDRYRNMHRMNEAATLMTHRVEQEAVGLRAGEALQCVNAFHDPKGCGYGEGCESCMIRKTIAETFETGRDYQAVEASMPYTTKDGSFILHLLISTTLLRLSNQERVLVCLENITELKKANEKIHQSEERYRNLFKNSPAVLLVIDPNNADIIAANPAAVNFYGWRQDEITTKKLTDINTLESHLLIQEMAKAKTGQQTQFHFQHRLSDGTVRDVEVFSGPIELNGKQLLLLIIHDITDRKRAEQKLKKSENTARALLNASTESAFLIDKEGTFVEMNEITAARLGCSVEELIGKCVFDLIPPDLAKERKVVFEKVIDEKKSIQIQDKRAELILDTNIHPVIDEEGNVSQVAFFAADITHEKKIEYDLITSKNALFLRNKIADILLSHDGTEIYSEILSLLLSEFGSNFGLFGYIDQEGNLLCPSLTTDVWDRCKMEEKSIIFPQSDWGGLWGNALKEKKLMVSNQPLNPPKGHVPLSNALVCPIIHCSELIGLLAFANKTSDYNDEDLVKINDIAQYIAPILQARLANDSDTQKRKEAEQRLKENEEKFAMVFKINPAIVGLAELETGNYVEVNQTFYDKLGFSPDEVIGKRASEVVQMDFTFRDKALAKLNKNGQIFNEEALVYTKNATPINVLLSAEIIELQGKKYNFTAAQDVTELKKVEDLLRLERDKLIRVYESMEDGIYIADQQYNIEFANRALINEFGSYQDKKCFKYFYGLDKVCQECCMERVLGGEIVRNEVFNSINQRFYDCINTCTQNSDGSVSKLQIMRDVSDQKESAILLQEGKINLAKAQQISHMGNWSRDLLTNRVSLSDELYRIIGSSPQVFDATYDNYLDRIYPDDREIFKKATESVLDEKKTYSIEYRIIRPNGDVRFVREHGEITLDNKNIPITLFGIVQDITKDKKVKEEIKERENRFINIISNTKAGYFFIDTMGCFREVNRAWLEMHGYSSRGEVIGHHFSKTQIDMDLEQANDIVNKLLNDELLPISEFSRRNKDGSIGYHTFSLTPVKIKGKTTGLEGFIIDSTDRKQTEEQIKASLKEKETLLHEIHHRVKNNLTVVSSLLKLQAHTMEDERLKIALSDSLSRVQAMSAIHETLYQSENLSAIDMNTYLSKLGNDLARNYSIGSKVTLKVKAKNILIGTRQASPIGLIVNELTTNSLKYAFPNTEDGEIKINLHRAGNQIELEYTDNGIGLPDDFDWSESKSLGLKLVRTLVENQLDGSIDMESNNGIIVTIKFNIET